MSEIKGRELVEQLVNTLNDCRLHPSKIYQWIGKTLSERIDTEIKCINIAELNQRIQFDRLEEITQANGYFSTLA
jgi:hypothetical protein